ncbi:unnamed protein product [Hermetia illucens]|uniref:Secreted protein n=1 Tax=Hermetia illucens TaxID=343691 RepID=A0A7R8UCN1_HERIL|nr:unnamed protein product [Hermetia illucens]
MRCVAALPFSTATFAFSGVIGTLSSPSVEISEKCNSHRIAELRNICIVIEVNELCTKVRLVGVTWDLIVSYTLLWIFANKLDFKLRNGAILINSKKPTQAP